LFYHLNFTAEISDEAWQTADDIRDNTDEIQEDTAEPVVEDAITITANDEDLENTGVAVAPAMVEIAEDKLERKPEEELFVLVDDDLDNDIINSHAQAFYRVDPQLDETPSVATSQPLTASKTSAAEDDAAKKAAAEKTVADVTRQANNEDTAAAKAKTGDKTTPKRLVFGAEWYIIYSQWSAGVSSVHRGQQYGTSSIFDGSFSNLVGFVYARMFLPAKFPSRHRDQPAATFTTFDRVQLLCLISASSSQPINSI